ncbi:MAG: outer rane chaperone Skp (OmpH) [Bacteroidetes bacterium]|jgi:outer membrane protein|nr:outer rane chaperone Skp (OmpH) [Bacteroidota bacterium]
MKKGLNIFLFVIVVAAVLILGYKSYTGSKKLGFITTNKVFDEFVLKKELEGDLKKINLAKQSYLDSLKLKIQSMAITSGSNNENALRIEEFKKMYLLKEEQFNAENEALFQQYNDKIWKQLNQYVEDYAKENGYDYLFGASGQGNLMYASETDDVTDDVLKYVNLKYSGKTN